VATPSATPKARGMRLDLSIVSSDRKGDQLVNALPHGSSDHSLGLSKPHPPEPVVLDLVRQAGPAGG
jgi:hypothetical protein